MTEQQSFDMHLLLLAAGFLLFSVFAFRGKVQVVLFSIFSVQCVEPNVLVIRDNTVTHVVYNTRYQYKLIQTTTSNCPGTFGVLTSLIFESF